MKELEFEGAKISSGDLASSLRGIYEKEILKTIKITSSKIMLRDLKDLELADSVEKQLIQLLLRR